ncbi:uncharacterized protein B0I36DRAFT_354631 [Microdochium trichocladiopsis]|uniref:Uncharacterized protein n=1 Tax=Microdochium trichocladiopsis TaxID=1682393 RepID=A0A9P8XUW4_9PEZI|nr:uncharacterized protein B0I36DRAFT_354631 [Microdochium trichocladiopsis]KAH7018340.1 hypothetical protein B0I36DRAFT_354631 [Microdochium trichocladiopsis]
MPSKTILITGCGPSGIGPSLAKEFQLRGHRVIATGLNTELLDTLAGLGIETVVMDVTSESSIAVCVAQVRKLTRDSSPAASSSRQHAGGQVERDDVAPEQLGPEHGYIDMLINNAGTLHILPFADTTASDIKGVFDVNVVGAMCVTRAFIPLLVAGAARPSSMSDSHDKHCESVIANVCSMNSDLRPPFLSLYNASKAALDTFGATIRPELAPLGVRVVTLKTGAIQTDLFAHTPSSEVPSQSYYRADLGEYLAKRGMFAGTTFMEVADYAKSVAGMLCEELERGGDREGGWGWGSSLWNGGWRRRRVIWEGNLVSLAWVVRAVRWDWFWDWVFTKGNRLDQVRRPDFGTMKVNPMD